MRNPFLYIIFISILYIMTTEVTNVKDALNEYFKLKGLLEEQYYNIKRNINKSNKSNKEKRAAFLQYSLKCVNCKKPSKKGNNFSITFVPETDENEYSYRVYKASCGYLPDPCNLNIEIHIGTYHEIEYAIKDIRNDINDAKKSIIIDKNKLLFGLITTETALNIFEEKKSYITMLTSMFEIYLNIWNKIIENQEEKKELEDTKVQSYEQILIIKDYIRKMNEENNISYARDAVEVYVNILEPLLNKIRHLKYKKNYVHIVDNKCVLVQQKYTIDDILVNESTDKVVAFDVGLKLNKKNNQTKTNEPLENERENETEMNTEEEKEPNPVYESPNIE